MPEKDDPLYVSGMRKAEARAFLLELPWILGILAAVALVFVGWRVVVVNLDLYPSPFHTAIAAAVLDAFGIALVLFAASYYPKKVMIHPRGLRFQMIVGKRELAWSAIEGVELLSPEAARKTFLTLRAFNLSPALSGAVMVKRKRGRPWVFSPEEPEQFVNKAREFLEGVSEDG